MIPTLLPAVASPRRQEILRLLTAGERSAGDIHAAMPDVTFGAVSLQLKVLRQAGLVVCRTAGQQRIYRLEPDAVAPVRAALEAMWRDRLWSLKLAAELVESRRGPQPGRSVARRRRRSNSRSLRKQSTSRLKEPR